MKLDINDLDIRILLRKIFDNFHLSISRCDSRLRRRSFLSLEDFRKIFGSKKKTRLYHRWKQIFLHVFACVFDTNVCRMTCRMTRVELTERGQQRLRSHISNLIVQFQCEHARFVFPT